MSEIIEMLKGPKTFKQRLARLSAVEDEMDSLLHEYRRLHSEIWSDLSFEQFQDVIGHVRLQWLEADNETFEGWLR